MTPADVRTLCGALAFLAVITKDGDLNHNNERRVYSIAQLMETFCLTRIPGAFYAANINEADDLTKLDDLIEELKFEKRASGGVALPESRETLLQLHQRLLQRHAVYASDDMLAARVHGLLTDEITHRKAIT